MRCGNQLQTCRILSSAGVCACAIEKNGNHANCVRKLVGELGKNQTRSVLFPEFDHDEDEIISTCDILLYLRE